MTVAACGADFLSAAEGSATAHLRQLELRGRLRHRLGESSDAKRLLEWNQGRWAIENKNHFIRDAAFGEDGGWMRTGHGPTSCGAVQQHRARPRLAAGPAQSPNPPPCRHFHFPHPASNPDTAPGKYAIAWEKPGGNRPTRSRPDYNQGAEPLHGQPCARYTSRQALHTRCDPVPCVSAYPPKASLSTVN